MPSSWQRQPSQALRTIPRKQVHPNSLAAILQTSDPLFPIGSYAHSYGLEQFTIKGDVSDPQTLRHFIKTCVYPNLQDFELPYLRFLYEVLDKGQLDQIAEIDQEIGASKASSEIRGASAAQGRQRLRLLSRLRPSALLATLAELKASKRLTPHHLTVFAAEYLQLQVSLQSAQSAWSYQAIAAPCSAALKLFRIGQEGAQIVLTESIQDIKEIVESSNAAHRDFAGAFVPALDIACQQHEHAFARLFIS